MQKDLRRPQVFHSSLLPTDPCPSIGRQAGRQPLIGPFHGGLFLPSESVHLCLAFGQQDGSLWWSLKPPLGSLRSSDASSYPSTSPFHTHNPFPTLWGPSCSTCAPRESCLIEILLTQGEIFTLSDKHSLFQRLGL